MSPIIPPINLSSGFPAPSLFPLQQLNRATNAVFSKPAIWHEGMIYGPDEGHYPLRRNIARWLSQFYYPNETPGSKSRIDADRICITGGASQNLACLLQVFTDPVVTRNVFIVEPGYFLSFRVFEDAGFHGRLRGVPEDEEGIDLAFLEERLRKEDSQSKTERPYKPQRPYRKLYRNIIYCVPTFSNPSGKVMSLSRRTELIRLARKYDALVIADDVYDFVHWSTSPSSGDSSSSTPEFRHILPRLVDIDRTLDGGPIDEFGNCVSNGSFSKIVGPGCRVGWAEGTPAFAYGVSQVGSTHSGGAPSQLMSTFVNEMLEFDTSKHNDCALTTHILETLIPAYSRRYKKLTTAVKEHLCPYGIIPAFENKINVGGGFFVWLKLPESLTSAEVVSAARQDGVIVGDGRVSALPEGNARCASYEDMIRLCFAWVNEEELVEAVTALAGTLARLLEHKSV